MSGANAQQVTAWRRRQKAKAVAYKGGKCAICGYDKCQSALEFHHTDPAKKDFHPGSGHTRAWDRVKAELDKCLLLCANCHREAHDSTVPVV